MDNLKVYEGSEPYIFISYSHKQNDIAYKLSKRLIELGYRVWFDNGITLSTKWLKPLADKTKNCSHFLAIVNKGYFDSLYCKCEIEAAIDSYAKNYKNNNDKDESYAPITLLFTDGMTIDTIPEEYSFILRSFQHCSFEADETFDENSEIIQKMIRSPSIARCRGLLESNASKTAVYVSEAALDTVDTALSARSEKISCIFPRADITSK